ncbi:DUF664 domain-containing protein [Kitasatospora sp. NPDC088783]|uniref:mycothiol transferase n=1 Tax=Kitasatospora sp. NPDC088783 TaxID=3364077 RepID=UPI003812E754
MADESDDEFRSAPGETSARAFPSPGGAPWFPTDVEEGSMRRVLLHLIEETARRGGPAGIVRESLDGAAFYPADGRRRAVARPVVRVLGARRVRRPRATGRQKPCLRRPDGVEALLRTRPTLEAWPPIPC